MPARPGTIAAATLYEKAKPAVLAERTDFTAAGVKSAVRNGMCVMPRFCKTEVFGADLKAVIAYLVRAGVSEMTYRFGGRRPAMLAALTETFGGSVWVRRKVKPPT